MMIMVLWMNLMVATPTETYTVEQLLQAIRLVESGDDPSAVGDGGKAIGCYQIWRVYWIDSGIPGTYQDCYDREYSTRVVRAYWKRYATKRRLGREPTLEDLARIHNGGPNGYKKQSTIKYWRKIQEMLKRISCSIEPALIVPSSLGGCLCKSFGGSSVLGCEATRSLSHKLGRGLVLQVTHQPLMLMSTVGNDIIVIMVTTEGVEHVMLGMVDVVVSSEQVVELSGVVVDPLHVLPGPFLSGRFWSGPAHVITNKVLEVLNGSLTTGTCHQV